MKHTDGRTVYKKNANNVIRNTCTLSVHVCTHVHLELIYVYHATSCFNCEIRNRIYLIKITVYNTVHVGDLGTFDGAK